jgi:transposase-like protein
MKTVAEYEHIAGDETQDAFARRKGLNVGTFRYWLYKAREERPEQPSVRFVELKAAPLASTSSGDVEVTLDQGKCTVRFGSGVDAARIGEVVAVLAGRLQC